MPGSLSTWPLFVRTWRSACLVFGRLPLLVLSTWLFYAIVLNYSLQILPFAAAIDLPARIFNRVAYLCVHSVIFAPLATAVMLMVMQGNARQADAWSASTIFVGVMLAIREIVVLLWVIPLWFFSIHEAQLFHYLSQHNTSWVMMVLIIDVLPRVWYLGIFAIWIRLALLFPIAALGERKWNALLAKAWHEGRRRYGFALVGSVLAILPYFVVDDYVDSHVYRYLIPGNVMMNLPLWQWGMVLLRSAELTGRCIVYASLAAWLYRAIAGRNATAP